MAFRGEILLFSIRLPEAMKVEDEARAFLNSTGRLLWEREVRTGLFGLFSYLV
jgi:hypothetical protein